jgi:hypothetical protein
VGDIVRKNENCFIGMPSCGYVYESAKLCFIACPSHEKYTLKIDVIKDLIESHQYECHIALKRIDPGTFAFCTKICSRIIQSQFCIVFLDPSYDKVGSEYPNPNVHFEYGMMVGQNKYIIPLQDERYDLAFNISPLDTIKYNDSNFKSKVSEAINHAITRSSEKKEMGTRPQTPEVLIYYNLIGFRLSDTDINFLKLIWEHGSGLGFFLFDNKRGKYRFIGPFDSEDPKLAILHTKLLVDNLSATYENLMRSQDKTEEEKKEAYGYFTDSISIDIIISRFYDKDDILQRLKGLLRNGCNYPVTIYWREDFQDYIEGKYKEIGAIEPIRPNRT